MTEFNSIDMTNEMVVKIVKASFEVFALNDIKKASTNMIVKKAGISRGILYHYFKDKEALFNFLCYYSLQKSIHELDNKMDWSEKDLIKRIRDITKLRLDSLIEFPYMMSFSEKYKEQVFSYADKAYLHEWRGKLLNLNIDYSLFKDTENMEQKIHLIRWTNKGLYHDLVLKHGDNINEEMIEKLKLDCDKYFLVLKDCLYK